ncbi:MAG: hypothetical protein JWM16_1467 [Verrucomicrobiales bacterium]|nr:hypothetical protein [Verrucomicrobiales bacterium]
MLHCHAPTPRPPPILPYTFDLQTPYGRMFASTVPINYNAPMNRDLLQPLARDLRSTPPRSPRDTLGGFVIAARMLDKARADLLGLQGEYNYYPCGLGAYFWKFTGLDPVKFKDFVASGASDAEVDAWIRENTTVKDSKAVIKWNNHMIGLRLTDLDEGPQAYLADYIPKYCKPPSKVKFFFDVYDVEEGVL